VRFLGSSHRRGRHRPFSAGHGWVSILVIASILIGVVTVQGAQQVSAYCYYPPCGTTTTTTTRTATSEGWVAPLPLTLLRGIVAYVPVSLLNSQPIPTPRVYDQWLVVNSSLYRPFEASGLENVEFFTSHGAVIPSWLESGNSNSSKSTVYWLRMSTSVPADGNVTVYMGFAGLQTNLFRLGKAGEAPQLSPTYAQYDNGRSVFSLYDDFKVGSSNSLWGANLTAGGSFVRSNSLKVNFGAAPGFFATKKKFGPGTAFDSLVTSFANQTDLGWIATSKTLHDSGNGNPDWAGDFIRSSCNRVFPDQWNSSGEANRCGDTDGYILNGTSAAGVYTVIRVSPKASAEFINYTAGPSTTPVSGDYPPSPASGGYTGQGLSLSLQWARVRVAPPNGVQPSVEFGPPHAIVTISSGAHSPTNPLFFVPSKVTVATGTVVTWVNRDSAPHTSTSDGSAWDSGSISPGEGYSHTFAVTGDYPYHCNFHPWMHGEIVVVTP